MPQAGFLQCCSIHPRTSVHAPKEGRRRAEHARSAYFARLAVAGAKARRGKRSGGAAA